MSIYRLRKQIEEKKNKQEEEKKVWVKIFTGVCASSNCSRLEVAVKWANEGTEEYLKKFYKK